MKETGLELRPRNCQLFAKKVNFLGHVVSQDGVVTDQDKTDAIRSLPDQKVFTEFRSCLGTIDVLYQILRRLHTMTVNGKEYLWRKECQHAF